MYALRAFEYQLHSSSTPIQLASDPKGSSSKEFKVVGFQEVSPCELCRACVLALLLVVLQKTSSVTARLSLEFSEIWLNDGCKIHHRNVGSHHRRVGTRGFLRARRLRMARRNRQRFLPRRCHHNQSSCLAPCIFLRTYGVLIGKSLFQPTLRR